MHQVLFHTCLIKKKSVIVLQVLKDADAIFEQFLKADVEVGDVEAEDGAITVYTEPTDLHKRWRLSRANGTGKVPSD